MNIDELLQNPAFQNIEQNRLDIFKKMYLEMQGKNQMEQMFIFMKYSKNISEGKNISNEQREMMIEVMMNGLSESEQANFKNMLKMIKL